MPVPASMSTACQLFRDGCEAHPGNIAVHAGGRDWTYRELWARALSTAAWLRSRGIGRGERVAFLLPNSAEYVMAYFGTLLAGGIAVGLDPDTTPRQLAAVLEHCAPAAAFVAQHRLAVLEAAPAGSLRAVVRVGADASAGVREVGLDEVWGMAPLDPPDDIGPEDVAQIVYTSGTTGRPKGVTLRHRSLAANTRSILAYLELTERDRVFVILPLHYSYGSSLVLTHAAVGGRLVIAPDFVFWNRALDLLRDQAATGFAGVPSSFAMLLARSDLQSRSFPALRYLTCSGGRLAPALVTRLRAALPGAGLYVMYGQTEGTSRLSTLRPDELDARPGSMGRAIAGVSLSVVDEEGAPVPPGTLGEIVARGDNVMAGYWNDPEETSRVLRPEGLRTGDLATMDEDGYLYFIGRKSDLIKSGGHRISPGEIEEVVLELEGVAETAVVGLPDEMLGEVPIAFVVRAPNAPALSTQEVIDHCQRYLPRAKVVREVRFMDSLPRTSSGKVKRRALLSGPEETGPPNPARI